MKLQTHLATRRLSLALLLLSLSVGCGKSKSNPAELRLAAAASLVPAMEELAGLFKEGTVTVIPGASGKLAKQIQEGAPFDVFASADAEWADRVLESGDGDKTSRLEFAYGRVAVWTADGVAPLASLAELADPRFKKIGLANPDHAPYGKAARQAMQRANVWTRAESRVVYGADVRQALQFAETGNAEVCVVALGLLIGKERTFLVDDSVHSPLTQVAISLHPATPHPLAAKFLALLQSREGQAVLRKYGLLQRGEAL